VSGTTLGTPTLLLRTTSGHQLPRLLGCPPPPRFVPVPPVDSYPAKLRLAPKSVVQGNIAAAERTSSELGGRLWLCQKATLAAGSDPGISTQAACWATFGHVKSTAMVVRYGTTAVRGHPERNEVPSSGLRETLEGDGAIEMALRTAVAIRHVHFEDLGAFAEPIREAGYAIEFRDAGLDELERIDALDPELVIVLGGPISAYEEETYPFIMYELALLESRLAAGRPTLGICLGAQLMARALGAHVYPGQAKEIGWGPVFLTDAGRAGALRHLQAGPVLHWHGDTFTLPEGAVLLASTEVCENQAFAFGSNALAFQFHPEAERRGFERWLIGHAAEIAGAKLSVSELRAQAERFADDASERGQACVTEWLGQLAR
jgi:GMP synthase (glutamine-hydrolysing)